MSSFSDVFELLPLPTKAHFTIFTQSLLVFIFQMRFLYIVSSVLNQSQQVLSFRRFHLILYQSVGTVSFDLHMRRYWENNRLKKPSLLILMCNKYFSLKTQMCRLIVNNWKVILSSSSLYSKVSSRSRRAFRILSKIYDGAFWENS